MKCSTLLAAAGVLLSSFTLAKRPPPNVVFILTDDQDVLMDSMDYMQGVQANLQAYGTTYTNHFCTVSLCCPSRATLWTGKAAHNTNITGVQPPYGGYEQFIAQGYNNNWLPVWLQKAGYKTYYAGKLFNALNISNYNHPPIHGLTSHNFLLEPGTYQYLNATFQYNKQKPISYPGNYTTTLLTTNALELLDQGVQSGSPFFLGIGTLAPHASAGDLPPVPAEKYKHFFPDVIVPRGPNFNPDQPSGASYIRDLPILNQTEIDYNDNWYRQRLRTLQSVDILVNKTVAALASYGILNNTYIIYSSDNGFHISQHRLQPGKREPYEEDIRVPLVIRGPGIPAGATVDFISSHMDLAPTILHWAGATAYAPPDLDGQRLPYTNSEASGQNWEHVQVEHWGPDSGEGKYATQPVDLSPNNTYKALRVIGSNYSLYYSVWCTGEHELYDMTNDTAQMDNLFNYTGDEQILGVEYPQLISRLDALTLVLKTCSGTVCANPWTALHPEGDVSTLVEALNATYDSFYENQNKVAFQTCPLGYFPDLEQPLDYHVYGNSSEMANISTRMLSADPPREFEDWLTWRN